jgi:hypothetical protein
VAMHSISFDERDSAGSGLLSLAKPASQQACRSALNMTFRYSGVFFRPRCSSSTHVRRPLRNEVTWPNCPHGGAAAGAALRLVVAFNAGRGSVFPLMTVRRRHLGWPSGCGRNSSMPAGGQLRCKWSMARALRSIGAKRIRRIGRSEWVWQLSDSDAATSESGRVRKNPSKMRCRKANKTRHF